jgi:hypothetical protein
MSQRRIRKSHIKAVLAAKSGYECPGQTKNSIKKCADIKGKKITVVYIETRNTFHIITLWVNGE